MNMSSRVFIHQIFYDEATRAQIHPDFIPLDNTRSPSPDWFEFWPILNFLNSQKLDQKGWYGFLSPKFVQKVGYSPQFVKDFVEACGEDVDAALFSPGWDQICFFKNPWEQGEVWHPSLTEESQRFFDEVGWDLTLSDVVSDMSCTVFSNYIVARPCFWAQWQVLANQFSDYAGSFFESGLGTKKTPYGSGSHLYPMKTFIQERFATAILLRGRLRTVFCDPSSTAPIFSRLFPDNSDTRRALQCCDLLKRIYRSTLDPVFLDSYTKIRRSISYSPPEF